MFDPRAIESSWLIGQGTMRWRDASRDQPDLASVARGQELVLDVGHDPDARTWLRELLGAGTW
jgi:hypothetical protein